MSSTRRFVVVVASGLLALALVGCGASSGRASEGECARAVLGDWTDGSIDRTYPENCYLAAIDALPEDLRAYSSAQDDILRALNTRSRSAEALGAKDARALTQSPAVDGASAQGLAEPPLAVVLLAAVVGVVLAAGLIAVVLRRVRRGAP